MASRIILKNSHIEITDYELGECPRIESQFMLWDRITHSNFMFGMHYDEEDKILYLPRGIDVWFLEQALQLRAVVDHHYDRFKETGDMKLTYGPRDDVQKEALRFMLGKGEYKQNENASQLSVNLRTGGGKTYLTIAAAAYFEYTPIIITYSVSWIEQWMERTLQYCKLSKKDLCYINGSAGINRLFKTGNPQYKMYFITHSTIQSYASQYGWKKIGELFKHLGIGFKAIDEAHLNFENMSMIDFYTNTYITFYLTATPARSGEDENRIYSKYFKNVPHIELFNEEEDPHTNYIGIKFNSHPTVFDISDCKNQYGLDRNKYIDYLVNKPQFYLLANVIVDLAIKAGGKVLIYIGTNAAIQRFYNWFCSCYGEYANDIGIYTTLSTKEEKEDVKENKRFILSTTRSAGAAVDIKGLKMTIVLNEPFKSHVTAQQSLGRTRDDNTYYIECVDIGFAPILKYYRYKKPIFDKYAKSVSEMVLKDDELARRNETIINNRRCHAVPLIARPLITEMTTDYIQKPVSLIMFNNLG